MSTLVSGGYFWQTNSAIPLDKRKQTCYHEGWQNNTNPFTEGLLDIMWFSHSAYVCYHIFFRMSSQIFSCLRKGARRHWCVLYFSILIAVPKKQRKAFILREAIFKSNAFEQTIDATAIHSMSDYQENYRGNLYCCTPGCPAKVKWVSHNGKMPFFATWPYSQHASSCPYAFERDPSKTAERSA